MKKLILGVVALMALTFTACEDDDDDNLLTVNFEDITLDASGLEQNDSISGSIASGDLNVTCTWSSSEWGTYGSGFSVSNHTNDTTAGFTNPYSCIAASGANSSENYATFNSSSDSIKFNSLVDLESVMLCNNTYAYLSMKDGDDYANEFATDDYFKLTLELYGVNGTKIGTEDFYLADFRDGKTDIVNEWTKLDLNTYKSVSYIKFSFESTDNGDWGMNTPAYFCIDNIAYYEAE